ncbi:hypothetical protein ACH4PU_14235 [Streptomyces sp. NPDC021100]|uniref:hypothetical protein n=1 Tax=Streptomyces sp. NPDC021100 TaxID=3365114 RepID=UPI0037932D1C
MFTGISSRTALRRATLSVAGLTAASLLFGAGAAYAADATAADRAATAAVQQEARAAQSTAEQYAFINDGLGPEARAEIEDAMASGGETGRVKRAIPIAAAAIAAAAWCARGAVASVPTSVLSDVADGKFSGKGTYAKNAIIGCLGGEIGGWAWKVLPGWVKNKAVSLVAAFIIKYIR